MARVNTAKKATHAPSKHFKKQLPINTSQGKKGNERKADSRQSKGKSSQKERDSLRDEILALGGDDDDYELLKDVDSDKEILEAGSSKKDAALSKDLQKFMKGLDFSSVKPADGEEEPDLENGAEQEDDEGSEGDLSETAEQKIEKKAKLDITIPKVAPNSRLLLDPTPQWYSLVPTLPPSKTTPGPPPPQTLSQKQSKASTLHSTELTAYENATSNANKLASSSSDTVFLQRILTSGTLSDRLSALTLLAQSSPVHNTRALETLRGMASKKGREESLKALRAICDWWIGGGAPDRKLKYFIDQPLSHPGLTDKHLLLWHFEDWLKKYFYSILQILETLSLDPLLYVRLQAMGLIFALLRDKPEQEQNLLRLLVNKLGDSERSVASRASYHLLQLLQAHPSMKAIVLREISALILKPSRSSAAATTTSSGATHLKFTDNSKPAPKPKAKSQDKTEKKDLQQEHSRYYAAITLNQIMLAPTETDRTVAVQLIGLYFELFKEILGAPAKPLDGGVVNTAENVTDHSRYGKEKRKKEEEKTGKGKQKEQGDRGEGFAEVEDSSSKLISAILTGVNRALPFAKLSLEDVEFTKHIGTLFLISHKSTFNISLQALRLIMQICQSLKSTPSTSTSSSALSASITDRYYRTLYSSLQDTRLDSSSKQAMYLNLLLKSLKMDTKVERVKAFVRRFVQLLVGAGNGGTEFVAGGLYLLGELFKAQPALRELLGKSGHVSTDDKESYAYDPKKRDPQYANADASPMWELIPLLSHYHPTVRLHASQLLAGKELTATADLSLNTLSHFLDRFVYKNPKKLKPKGPSAMQPAAASDALDGTSIRLIKGAQNGDGMVNNEKFWNKDVGDVPVDQIFYHKYFSKKNEKERGRAEKLAKRKGGNDGRDETDEEQEQDEEREEEGSATEEAGVKPAKSPAEEDEDESEGEAEIWKAMQATNPDFHPDVNDDGSPSDDSSDDVDIDSDSDSGAVKSGHARTSDPESSVEEDEEDEDDEALSLAEASDADDLVSLNSIELPSGLVQYHSDSDVEDSEDGEWAGFNNDNGNAGMTKTSRKRPAAHEKEDRKKKRRRLRALPTFATYEDYAKLIEGEPEDNI